MMMWHGTHCGSLRTYFADKDIFETARNLDEKKSASTSLGPRRRGPLVSGQYQSRWRSQRRPRYLNLEPESSSIGGRKPPRPLSISCSAFQMIHSAASRKLPSWFGAGSWSGLQNGKILEESTGYSRTGPGEVRTPAPVAAWAGWAMACFVWVRR